MLTILSKKKEQLTILSKKKQRLTILPKKKNIEHNLKISYVEIFILISSHYKMPSIHELKKQV